MSNAALLHWLDAAAEATEGRPTERKLVLWLAERAAEHGLHPAAPSIIVEPAELGVSYDALLAAVGELKRGQWIRRGWLLTTGQERP